MHCYLAANRPADVGLPAGNRRRTAGLRREEVALLASVSPTYYTFLEQGRPVRPSEQVLDALADALRLTAAERRYLRVLAHGADPGAAVTPAAEPVETIDPEVTALVQRLEPDPAIVKGRRWDVLAANPVARRAVHRLDRSAAGPAQPGALDVHHPAGPRGLPRLGAGGPGHAGPVPAGRGPVSRATRRSPP